MFLSLYVFEESLANGLAPLEGIRCQLHFPVVFYKISEQLNVDYVDTITLAGPCKIIAEQDHKSMVNNVKFRMDISVNQHLSKTVYIVGHVDCAAVTVSDDEQKKLVLKSVEVIKSWGFDADVIGLWVNDNWTVEELN